MRLVFLILITAVFSSTSCLKSRDETKQPSKGPVNEQAQQVSSFNCSAIKKTLNSGVMIIHKQDFDDINIEGLNRVDQSFYESAGLEKVFNVPYSNAEVYFYASTNLADCSIILLGINQADDIRYQMHMINLDSGGKIKSDLLLSQYIPYPDGEEFTRSIYGDKSNALLQITIKSSIGDYNKDTDKYSMVVDSIGTKYVLNKSGTLTLIQRESIRMIKQ